MPAMDYNKLLGKITEVCGTRKAFAAAMEMGFDTLSNKLNGKSAFTSDEIYKAVKLLKIKNSDIPAYFFAEVVRKP